MPLHFHVVGFKEIERSLELLSLKEGQVQMVGRRPGAHDFCGLDVIYPVHLLPQFGRIPVLAEILFLKDS